LYFLKKLGIAIFVQYFVRGAITQPKKACRHPLQNYLHAVVGLMLVGLTFNQVCMGYQIEWPTQSGRGSFPRPSVSSGLW
jgi:hypothetical protein